MPEKAGHPALADGHSLSLEQMLRDFHDRFPPAPPAVPTGLTTGQATLRCRLLEEEVTELAEAIAAGDPAQVLKEACDVIYVAAGTAVLAGCPLDEGLRLVHASNMTKTPAGTGKAVKGDGYWPAEVLIAALIAGAAARVSPSELREDQHA